MGFDSLGYYYFLYLIVCLFRAWSPSAGLLLAASLAFYGSFDWRHLGLLVGMAMVAFLGGISLAEKSGRGRLAALLTLVFLPLAFCKVGEALGWGLALPLGISFFTFHCASYLIDCNRGLTAPERSVKRFFLYVSFFPQLIAGPITRAGEILPQLPSLRPPGREASLRALWRIYHGLLKKLAVANVAWIFAGAVLAEPGSYRGLAVVLAVIAGRYYVFADFSGYTDIAIGSAGLLGITLPENFQRPFAAPSIAEYWRRWHITLSSWIRDYLLFPLTASPLARLGVYPLLVLTFVCLGMWHGISWNFLIYGLWHGVFLALHDATRRPRMALWRRLGLDKGAVADWLFAWGTFLLLVCPPTIFFLTKSPSNALAVLGALGNQGGRWAVKALPGFHAVTGIVTVAALELHAWISVRHDPYTWYSSRPRALRWLLALVALAWLGLAGEFATDSSFLYFRF